jgi:hypothetical protein
MLVNKADALTRKPVQLVGSKSFEPNSILRTPNPTQSSFETRLIHLAINRTNQHCFPLGDSE